MSNLDISIIDPPPPQRRLMLDALRTMRKPRPDGAPALPTQVLVRPAAELDASAIKAYAQVCGFRPEQGVPLTYPHMLAFPLHMLLLSARDFPYPAVGMVHLANRIAQHRRLEAGQALRVEVRCARWASHPKGQALVVATVAKGGGSVVWESESTYLSRGDGEAIGEAVAEEPAPDLQKLVQIQRWQFGADLGRRYAKVSGDHNPIHTSLVGAKVFGFRRPIAHGMWTKARALAGLLPGRPLETAEAAVNFKLPVYLPGSARLMTDPEAASKPFAVLRGTGGIPHLYGRLQGVATS